jgi:hypothetical protein
MGFHIASSSFLDLLASADWRGRDQFFSGLQGPFTPPRVSRIPGSETASANRRPIR